MHDASQISGGKTLCAHIRIVPSAEEDDDLETLSLVEDIRAKILTEVSRSTTYTVELVDKHTRGGGIIALVVQVALGIIAQKDLIIPLLELGQTGLDTVTRQRNVTAIDISIDGDSLHIENATHAETNKLIDLFAAQHPGKTKPPTTASVIEITGIVSKAERPALPEKTITEDA